jgi:sugar-specific transcriptional regulator TrmB
MNDNKLHKKLSDIGLNDKEASVYSCLLELGGAYPSTIAEKTKINRSTVYKILLELSVKGLVNEIEKSKKLFYHVADPQKLIRFSKEQLRIRERQLEKASELVPELRELFAGSGGKPRVLFFEGPDTMDNLLEDMVATNMPYEMRAFSNAALFKDFTPKQSINQFIKEKERKNITTRAIVPDVPGGRTFNETVFANIGKKYWPQIRYVDAEKFMFEAEITMYAPNKVSIAKLSGSNIIGVIIEDKTIHDMLGMIFEIAWMSAKE